VLSSFYIKQLLDKTSKAKEFVITILSNNITYSYSSTIIESEANRKYTNLSSNIYLSKYSIANYILLYIIV
jgi:hypothetical protein